MVRQWERVESGTVVVGRTWLNKAVPPTPHFAMRLVCSILFKSFLSGCGGQRWGGVNDGGNDGLLVVRQWERVESGTVVVGRTWLNKAVPPTPHFAMRLVCSILFKSFLSGWGSTMGWCERWWGGGQSTMVTHALDCGWKKGHVSQVS